MRIYKKLYTDEIYSNSHTLYRFFDYHSDYINRLFIVKSSMDKFHNYLVEYNGVRNHRDNFETLSTRSNTYEKFDSKYSQLILFLLYDDITRDEISYYISNIDKLFWVSLLKLDIKTLIKMILFYI